MQYPEAGHATITQYESRCEILYALQSLFKFVTQQFQAHVDGLPGYEARAGAED